MVATLTPNVCQYWITDEPVQCEYWDDVNKTCTFEPSSDGIEATRAPYCNKIGTAVDCNHYSGTGIKARCILPDPSRHVVNRTTGKKWEIDDITGYNDGDCDGSGTDTTCAGYSPYHMAFSKLQPTSDESIDDTGFSTIDEIGYRLPMNYEVYNKRAKLGRCYWWKDETTDFYIDNDPSSLSYGMVMTYISKCTNPDEVTFKYRQYNFDEDTGTINPPCNGANPSCPRYTSNVCWQYCIDEKMRQGNRVLAEQILELRYYIKKDKWTESLYEKSFKDPYIFAGTKAWKESLYQEEDKYLIVAARTYISDFEVFDIDYNESLLTDGTSDSTYKKEYPTLVRDLNNFTLTPIIRNTFDENSDGKFVFEVPKLQHKYIKIVGDVFYYGSTSYGVNLSDPDLYFLPRELLYFDSMSEIENNYIAAGASDGYTSFYNNLECLLENLIHYCPDKVAESEITGENSFYMDVETFFGNNDIFVFDKGSGVWEYDKISVKKNLCNGVVGQTSFSVDNSGGTISYLASYENSFSGFVNKSGEATFCFFPFMSEDGGAQVDYIYNDGVRKRLNSNYSSLSDIDTYEMCYKLYKVKVFDRLSLDQENFRLFGNAGWVLVTIPDGNILSNVIKPWEVSGDITITVVDALNVSHSIKMEVVDRESNVEKLEVNQIIIKPEDVEDFRQPCSAKLNIGPIYNYEKSSFEDYEGSESRELVRESFLDDDDVIDYRVVTELKEENGQYTLTKFGTETLMISVVFKGSSGRPKGQIKTKILTWVRQPYCRDVEIYYKWYAEYQKCVLLPEMRCYGTTGLRCEIGLNKITMVPPCGDHDLSLWSGKGSMWYPYEECDSVARWNIVGNLTEWDINIMDCFWEGVDPPHGSWDMRMLGPDQEEARTCGTHAQLWACTCDWSFCNYNKVTENIFCGTGMYRGGIDGDDYYRCIRNDGDAPKFGNVIRDFLRSFRSIDNIDYYYFDGRSFYRNRKWVPMPEFYTTVDVTSDTSEYPFLLYSSNDFYDDGGSFIHPMGLLLASYNIEGVDIEEELYKDDSGLETLRHRFDDVFETHSTVAGIYYPYPKDLYCKMVGGDLKPVMSWYTYKDFPGDGGGADKSIQWAWQEIWVDLERSKDLFNNITTLECSSSDDSILCCPEIDIDDSGELHGPYFFQDEVVYGKHCFIEVEYPDYRYDVELKEHRLVCDEGDHVIKLIPPDFSANDDGDINVFFEIQLDSGPSRLFDINGEWDPDDSHEYYDLYTTCTNSPWVETVTLFGTGYTSSSEEDAESDGRMILTYDSIGEEVKEYYQRGLDVALVPSKLVYLPLNTELLSSENYEVKFSVIPDEAGEEVEVDEWYSLPNCFYVMYYCGDHNEIEIEFNVTKEEGSDVGIISKLKCEFEFGAVDSEEEAPKGAWFGELYHLPAVEIYIDNVIKYQCDDMYLSSNKEDITTKSCVYDFNSSPEDILNSKESEAGKRRDGHDTNVNVKIKFRIAPTDDEITEYGLDKYYISAYNKVKINCIYLYHANFIEATENITTWERKYHISYGKHGDFPPHGYDSTGSLLYLLNKDRSTVYQYDSIGGVAGMPNSNNSCKTMNKCRGRIMNSCHADKEPLPGSDLYTWEAEQKKIYDAVVDSGAVSFQMTAVCPPGLQTYLDLSGSTFQPWSCAFVNTALMKLSPVIPRAKFNADGHRFDWDFSNIGKATLCGGLFSHFYRYDVFEYVYRRAAEPDSMLWDSMDALVAYSRGIGSFIVHPLKYLSNLMNKTDEYQNNVRSLSVQYALFDRQDCQLPPAPPIM